MLGTRRSELLSARWDDIDLNQNISRIPQTKDGDSHLPRLRTPALAILEEPSRGTNASEAVAKHFVARFNADATHCRQRSNRSGLATVVETHQLVGGLGPWATNPSEPIRSSFEAPYLMLN
jgi:integrase